MADVVGAARDAGDADTTLVWADQEWVLGLGESRETWFPMWHPHLPGFHAYDAEKATAAGLRPRPFVETIADSLGWDRERGEPALKAGMARSGSASSCRSGARAPSDRLLQVARRRSLPSPLGDPFVAVVDLELDREVPLIRSERRVVRDSGADRGFVPRQVERRTCRRGAIPGVVRRGP